ncbi:DNA polymerase beta superfamily protein [Streptomyces chiangmaiensis]|uniref:Nucleotidyltransferase domain-containing protein n=1 Tax=Streptomyces chiangmaiensis TaxID=766497 RepID=A0ABU7FJ33_9ACTN|nr:nucleotidyltransferase domain-containing protein [Streptomyces chiangmaiensis]MED7823353.1 nucleotidyltransferase domain-containing protein [Streptomyces chiangmaiensis]
MNIPHILLSGIVGSTAYGLAHAGSDVDRLGVFAAPTQTLHGLHRPKESHVGTAPDRTFHEAAKWCRLALRGNPSATELVWLPEELYEVRTALGDELIGIRRSFLSARRVRDAYLGYATQPVRRLESRSAGSLSEDLRRRTAKHARHLKRLCHQGLELYATGHLTVRLEDAQEYHAFGDRVAEDATVARSLLRYYENAFDEARCVLPQEPDEAAVESWLHRVRAHFYAPEAARTR